MSRRSHWKNDPAHPVADWKAEVANNDTRLGYSDWIRARSEILPPGVEPGDASASPRRRDPVRIRATDRLGNIAYIHREADRPMRCTLANGLSASLFYAGVIGQEMKFRFALDDCETADQALAIVRRYGSLDHDYRHAGPPPGFDTVAATPTAIALLTSLIADMDRIVASDPAMASLFDPHLVDRARTLVATETRSPSRRA